MKRLLLIVALLLVVAVSTAQVTTSAIRGQVTTNDNPLPGATIVALHTPSGSQYSTTTNGEGYYTISGMRIGGPYEITISFLGYDTVKVAGFALALGETAVYDFTLNEQSIDLEEVFVVGASSHSKEGYYNRTQMEKIPSIDRSIYDLTNILSSAVSPASGGIILGGQSTRYNAFSIDGSPAADIYGLGTTGMTGSLTRANPIPIDALDAVTITTSTVDVRRSGFTGGSIDAVTRSGSNDFRGSAYTYFNNEHFWGSTPGRDIASRTRLSEQMTNIVGVTLGGPIIKNKLHFFVAGEFNRTTTPSSHHPGSASSAITIDEAEQISERYEALTGYDGGGWKEHQVKDITGAAVARIDWNINDHNHLSVRYNMLNADAAASSNSAQSFYFTGAEYTNISRTHSLVAELNSSKQSRRGTIVENSLRAGYTRLKDGRTTPESLPAVIINGLGPLGNGTATIGTSPYSGRNMLIQDIYILSDNVSFSRGKHDITVGTSNEIYRADNLYLANARGTYTYASLEDFQNDKATQYAYGYFASGKRNPPVTTGQFAVYAQDEIGFSNHLKLSYGLRLDIPVMFDTPIVNEEFNTSDFAKMGTKTGDIPRAQILLSPRVGIEWKKEHIRAYANAGIYTGRIPFVWLSNCYQNTGLGSTGVSVHNPAETPKFSLNPEEVGIKSNPAIDIVARDFRYPQVFRLAGGVSGTVARGLRLSFDADFSKGFNQLFVENLVAKDNGRRLLVGGEGSRSSATYYDSTTSDFSAVYRLTNTNKGYSWSATARAEYSPYFAPGLSLSAAYTFAQSKSVNDGVSAQSSSNWGRTYSVDSNTPALSNSIYEYPHKVVATISYSRTYGRFGTNVMLLYNGHSGEHYSLSYARGKVDANGDSYRGNSLIYIPTEAEMATMLWADESSAAAFNDYIAGDKYLSAHRGEFAERNSHSLPFVHRLDLHLAESFYFDSSGRKLEISLDIINLSNLISRSWGMVHRTTNWTLSPVTITELRAEGNDFRPVYKFTGANYTVDNIASRWHMQLGLRIVF